MNSAKRAGGNCFHTFCPALGDTVLRRQQMEQELRTALARRITDDLGKALAPRTVEIVSELPKTRNAKVLRRVVRAVYLGADPGDLSSLENHSAIDALERVRPG